MEQAESVSLDEVCAITSSLVDPRVPAYSPLPHVGGANIETMTGVLLDLKSAEEEGLQSGKFLFDERMVLYSKIRPYLKKVARPDFRGLCSADVYPLLPAEGRLERGYLFYLLLTERFTEFAVAGSARAGMPKVNREHLFAFRFSLPSVAEQRRIVALLDEAFAGIAIVKANAEKNLQNARAVFESELQAIFAPRSERRAGVPLSSVLSRQPRNGWSPPAEYQTGTGTPVLTLSAVTGFEYDGSCVKLRGCARTRLGA